MTRVFVDGQEGTTGLRIREVLAGRDDIDVLSIDPAKRKDPAERATLLNAADVAFLCLPDDAAREAVAMVENPDTCVIDASTAHRTAPGWVYGLPELAADQRSHLRASKRIANPGCHATAFILLVRPLVDAGLVPAAFPLTATSLTGYSGGGRKMIEQYETSGDIRLASPRPYAQSDEAIVTHATWHGLSSAVVCEHGRGLERALRHVDARIAVALVNPGEERGFLAHGFAPTPRTIRFIGKRLTGDAPPLPKRRDAWHFTLGDLDFF